MYNPANLNLSALLDKIWNEPLYIQKIELEIMLSELMYTYFKVGVEYLENQIEAVMQDVVFLLGAYY